MPRDSRIAASDAAAMPFPREETTPPETNTYLVIEEPGIGLTDDSPNSPGPSTLTGQRKWRSAERSAQLRCAVGDGRQRLQRLRVRSEPRRPEHRLHRAAGRLRPGSPPWSVLIGEVAAERGAVRLPPRCASSSWLIMLQRAMFRFVARASSNAATIAPKSNHCDLVVEERALADAWL